MRPTRADRAIDHIDDIHGQPWFVWEYRPTSHGFAVAIGRADAPGQSGSVAILTPALAEYLQSVERPRDVILPVGRTTITRLRAALRLSFDWDAWWAARADDLASLTLAEFCARHRCSMGAASQRRDARPTPPPG